VSKLNDHISKMLRSAKDQAAQIWRVVFLKKPRKKPKRLDIEPVKKKETTGDEAVEELNVGARRKT